MQILLNPLVTCSNLLRAVSKELHNHSAVLDDMDRSAVLDMEELLQEPQKQRQVRS